MISPSRPVTLSPLRSPASAVCKIPSLRSETLLLQLEVLRRTTCLKSYFLRAAGETHSLQIGPRIRNQPICGLQLIGLTHRPRDRDFNPVRHSNRGHAWPDSSRPALNQIENAIVICVSRFHIQEPKHVILLGSLRKAVR